MAYCTQTDIEKLIPEAQLIRLTDDAGSGSVDTDVVDEAVASGSEEMDTYLAARYDLPLDEDDVPILTKINVDIAIYNLYSRVKEQIPETREKRYQNAVRFLEKVAQGKISIGAQPPPDPPAAADYEKEHRVSVRDRDFDGDTMDKY